MWDLLVNPAALVPVAQPGDLRQDRVGQLVKRVLDGVTSVETRRAYSHALEMFLAFCAREGNPTLSAELVASYRLSLIGEGKSSSTVGVRLAAIKALTRAAVMAGLMPAETAASIKIKFQQRYVMSHRNVVNCRWAKAFGQFCGSHGDHPVSRSVLGA
jgi:Phage integrase, N-terminal SAM-like domain